MANTGEISGIGGAARQAGDELRTLTSQATEASNSIEGLAGAQKNAASAAEAAAANGFDITRCIITEMPAIFCGMGESVYGKAKMTAFLGDGHALTDSNAFLVANTTAWSQSDYPTTHQEQLATLAWAALTDWANVFAEKGFKLTHEFKVAPISQGNVTIDQKIQSYRGMLSFLPQQPTTPDLLSALNYVIGSRRSGNTNNAVVTASGMSVTLYSAAVRQLAFHFDNKMNRHGELQLVTAMTGASTTRLAFS